MYAASCVKTIVEYIANKQNKYLKQNTDSSAKDFLQTFKED